MSKLTCFAVALLLTQVSVGPAQEREAFFEVKIRPVLIGSCFQCHGDKKVSGKLRVDSREALLKGGESGPAIVAGDLAKSRIIQAISYEHENLRMPPDKRLSVEVVKDFAEWVKGGAVWPGYPLKKDFKPKAHWAFEPVRKPMLPRDTSGWAQNPIDLFVLEGLRKSKLTPAGPADKRVLLRRLFFDVIGLPPTPEERDDFLKDASPAAVARVVDKLLASPHYGERWGRHWLDVARYADTAGDNADYPVPEARLYRDYVIDSLNADKRYDLFVREQIAGDILAKQGPARLYAERVAATGFLALSRRYGTGPYELWQLTLEDTIETTGRAFLGLTLRCARCHDHKFDPVTKEDYYALYGIFASTQFPWGGAEEFSSKGFPREHMVPLLPPEQAKPRLAAFKKTVERLDDEKRRMAKEDPAARRAEKLKSRMAAMAKRIRACKQSNDEAQKLEVEITTLQREKESADKEVQKKMHALEERKKGLLRPGLPPDVPGAYAVEEGKAIDVPVQVRGEVSQPGSVVKRNAITFLNGGKNLQIPVGSSGRLQLAEWLVRPENPLTARVMVNRIWQHHFGKGIVGTPSNFGLRGEEPTHPELLDWLAAELVEGGWSMKRIHRLILLSKTYQLGSEGDAVNATKDPSNRWYWHHDRRRLEAEAIRDAMLSVSGMLNRSRPGAHPFPEIRRWGWTQHSPFKERYGTRQRSVYLMTQRFQRHPFLALFDGPDTNTTTDQRVTSTVPSQALYLMNDPETTEAAGNFAGRIIGLARRASERVDSAYRLAWSRVALDEERKNGERFLETYVRELEKVGVTGERAEREAWTSFARILLSANEFVFVD